MVVRGHYGAVVAFGLFANLIIPVSGTAIFYSCSSCVRYVCVVYSECLGGVAIVRFDLYAIDVYYIGVIS